MVTAQSSLLTTDIQCSGVFDLSATIIKWDFPPLILNLAFVKLCFSDLKLSSKQRHILFHYDPDQPN